MRTFAAICEGLQGQEDDEKTRITNSRIKHWTPRCGHVQSAIQCGLRMQNAAESNYSIGN
eukprot:5823911-Pyramimonas_sp.AAC.2